MRLQRSHLAGGPRARSLGGSGFPRSFMASGTNRRLVRGHGEHRPPRACGGLAKPPVRVCRTPARRRGCRAGKCASMADSRPPILTHRW